MIARTNNEGFAAGVNAGWRQAQSPWLLILNPDVDVARGFLAQVLERLDHDQADPAGPPGIIGFGLRNPDGSPQGSVGVFPNLFRTIREQFIPRSRRKYQAAWRIRTGPVDWVTGACMLVNASMIDALGGMDDDFFLYYEEVAFSRAAQRLGWRVEYDASVTVVHRHPLQNRPISPKMRVITRHSKLLYFRKHLPRWQFECLAAIVWLEGSMRGLWAKLAGHREDARAWRTIVELTGHMRWNRPAQARGVDPGGIRPGSRRRTLSPPCEGGARGGGPGATSEQCPRTALIDPSSFILTKQRGPVSMLVIRNLTAGRDRIAAGIVWLIALAVLGWLSVRVVTTRGNLAWDDADYLRRGLSDARMARSAGGLWVAPIALKGVLLETPKPPWLVAWIELGALILGRHQLDLLILFSSVLPYAFLLLAVIVAGRSIGGAWGGLLALVCMVSSRSSLAMGGKVMVETYLSLWVLLAYVLAAWFLARPSRRRAMALGAVIGLGMLTKLTMVLFLPALGGYVLFVGRGREPGRWAFARKLLWCGGVALAVAGPWYARNLVEATRFAAFSARYNELAELRPERVPPSRRLVAMAEDLAGWPLCATLALAALAAWGSGSRRRR